ncbi:MAG TPA: flagellar basal body-associated FliL family protein [Longimicrobiales bacterium]|nr:flagellar basal body-associated FliL family protein [Longimicrobiales bacterium]
MSEVEVPQGEAASPPKSKVPAIIALVVGVAAGAGAGFVGLSMLTAPPSVEAAGAKSEKKSKEKEGEARPLYVLENLVVNPAGTKGQRFLIITAALEGDRPEDAEALKHSDAQLRDTFLRILGNKTVDELTDLKFREALKLELRRGAAAVIGKPDLHAIYLPQFVLQ